MASTIKELLAQAEACINQGRIPEAGAIMAKISLNKVARVDAIRVSKTFRRMSAFEQALRVMLPIVRPRKQLLKPATPQEKAECAICLHRVGSREEATHLLSEVSPAEVPEALLFRTIFDFSEWDYRGGAEHVRQLLKIAPPESALYKYAQLNLASAEVMDERFDEAEAVLSDLRTSAKTSGAMVILGNALEISAQVAIFTRKFDLADKYLSEAETILKDSQTLDWLWIVKWRAVLSAWKTGKIDALESVRTEALAKRHWETLRELDFMSCKIAFNENTFLKLYYGTNYKFYRERLVRHFGEPQKNQIELHGDSLYRERTSAKALNLFRDLTGELSPGDLPHILLLLLISDSYRGLRSGQVHSHLFPGAYFNPNSSLDRVHQVIKRVRQALSEQIPELQIQHEDGVYKLGFSQFTGTIEIPKTFPELKPADVKLYSLSERLQKDEFASADLQKAFSLSRSAANELISVWRNQGAVEIQSEGRAPIYKVKKAA